VGGKNEGVNVEDNEDDDKREEEGEK